MKSSKLLALFLVVLLAGCGGGGGSNTSSSNSGGAGNTGGSGSAGTTSNILAVMVNDPSYPNKATVGTARFMPPASNYERSIMFCSIRVV
jgi:hypothetical protein